jgi:heat shock protein HslJ
MQYHHFGILAVILLLVASCGCTAEDNAPVATPQPAAPQTSPAQTPVPTPAFPQQLAGKWVLSTMAIQNGSVPLIPVTEISLTLNPDGSASGWGGCNNYFTTYTLTGKPTPKGDVMLVGPITKSQNKCLATSQEEATYLQILGETGAYVVNGNLLTLTAKTQNALVYQQASTVTTTTYSSRTD